MGAATAIRIGHPHRNSTRWLATMFMIGAALFAIASVPGYASISERASAFTYAAGSVFFTLAALEQLRTSGSDWPDRWSALVQFAGTILFNVNTFLAVDEKLSPHAQDLLVWTPDAVGSACFLVASAIASWAVRERRDDKTTRRVADLNLLGSVAFGFSAIASYVVHDTNEVVNAMVANSGTFIGAICFFVAAWMLRRQSGVAPASSGVAPASS